MPPHSEVQAVPQQLLSLPTQSKSEFPTLSEIKARLPKDCFVAELSTSLYYVARSVLLAFALWSITYLLCSPESGYYLKSELARAVVWGLYWNLQGIIMWGVFVLGHDCGHASFSRYPVVNHIFGNILHSSILVPYESWKTTHRLHHKNTGNIDKDEIFYPHRDDTSANWVKRVLVISVGFAWIVYVYVNVRRHFWVFEDIYKNSRKAVTITHIWWLAAVMLVGRLIFVYGLTAVSYYYLAPLFVFMSWLVVTTFLHHQDLDAPWYGNQEWTYVKGNLSSIDRSYGPIVDNLIHSIGTHQIHHLFPKIPHYKLDRATEAFRKEFPHLVRKSDEHIIPAFVRNYFVYLKYATVDQTTQFFRYKDQILSESKKAN